MMVHTCDSSYVVGGVSRRIVVQAGHGRKRMTLSKKYLKQKGLGGMAQVVVHLPSNETCPSTTKINNVTHHLNILKEKCRIPQ
jgi:hypothetical protein